MYETSLLHKSMKIYLLWQPCSIIHENKLQS